MSFLNRKRKYVDVDEDICIDYDYNKIIENLNDININDNDDILIRLIKKIDNLDKKIDNLTKLNFKFETLQKNIDIILIEKDYIIDNLKDEINNLKSDMKDLNIKKNSNDYFF